MVLVFCGVGFSNWEGVNEAKVTFLPFFMKDSY